MEYLSNDDKDYPNQHENSRKLCNENGYPVLSFKETEWKLRRKLDQKSLMEKSHCRENTRFKRNKQIQKSRNVSVTVRDPRRKVNR